MPSPTSGEMTHEYSCPWARVVERLQWASVCGPAAVTELLNSQAEGCQWTTMSRRNVVCRGVHVCPDCPLRPSSEGPEVESWGAGAGWASQCPSDRMGSVLGARTALSVKIVPCSPGTWSMLRSVKMVASCWSSSCSHKATPKLVSKLLTRVSRYPFTCTEENEYFSLPTSMRPRHGKMGGRRGCDLGGAKPLQRHSPPSGVLPT